MDNVTQQRLAALFDEIVGEDRGLLNLEQASRLVEAAGLETAPWRFAASLEEALVQAEDLGYPLVLKVASEQVSHKSDSGGVELGITDESSLRRAYHRILERVARARPDARIDGVTLHRQVSGVELMLGANTDPQFGPTVMVGVGGIFVELYQDVAFRVAPLGESEALSALVELDGAALLDGFRGAEPVDRSAVARALVALSHLVTACPRIREVDLNPIFARRDQVLAADLRILVD